MSTGSVGIPNPPDARCVANLLLEEADRLGIRITNLALQKLLYFCHGQSLVEGHGPLVDGWFEAWKHGPVHPAVYLAFKASENAPITFRAMGIDALTGVPRVLPRINDTKIRKLVLRSLIAYGEKPASVLRSLAHARHGPWDSVIRRAQSSVVLSMRIPNELIVNRFRHHMIAIPSAARE